MNKLDTDAMKGEARAFCTRIGSSARDIFFLHVSGWMRTVMTYSQKG